MFLSIIESPQQPSISIYGAEKMGDTVTVTCSTFHTCPYSEPTITLNGLEGSDKIDNQHIKDGLWKITRTRKGVVKAERLTIRCSVRHYGGREVTAMKFISAKCVHQKITIAPELIVVTVGIAKNFVCRVYHSCQNENPTITWNYKNMQVTTTEKTRWGLNWISYSNIAFLATKEDNGKKLICTAKFSGGDITASVILHVKRVLLYDALGWEVSVPKDIHGLKGSCLVIPCSFNYKSNPPKKPRRVVWYRRDSEGLPLVYDYLYPYNVNEKYRGKTDLYGESDWNCSLLIKNLESSHNGEKLYTRIDPENIAWQNYETDDATTTVLIDATPQQPSISVSGGERTGDTIIVACSAFHTCPYSKPTITLNGIEGSDEIKDESVKDGLLKITLTRTGVVKAESTTIECSVTHHGDITVTATEVKSSKCVHHNISIEPELADVTVGTAKNFVCSVYHSCQKEPTITWNYKNMQVTTKEKTGSGLNWISYSNITFLAAKEDHGKKLICTAKFSGGDITASVILHVKRVLLYDALGWEVSMPKDIHGLKGSCLVIPCSFNYKSNPPKNPRRVVWYRRDSEGLPLVYDYLYPYNVNEKYRGKTDLYRESDWNCSLLIKNLESSHNGEKLYTRIDPENIAWQNYETDDTTTTVLIDESPQQPNISIYGGEKMGDTVTVICSTFHTCPYSKPTITLNGLEGSDQIDNEHIKDGLWKITLTRKGVVKAERLNIQCSVRHYGGITVTATKDKSAKCVHQKITIEPELTDVTVGIAKNFVCSVYHSCQKENPTITWNYKNMQVTTTEKTHWGLNRLIYSNIAFLATKEDNGKKLICTAKFSGGDITASVILHVKRVLLYDALGWEVSMPKDIHGLKGSCLVIPCSFSYKSNPPRNPRRVVWYRRDSKGLPLVYDYLYPYNVNEKYRGKTDLYRESDWDCSLLIKNLESSHNGEKLYTRIDPENIAWQNYETDDATTTVLIDATPQQPSISVYGGERTGDTIIVACSAFHTCPYSKPTITLDGIEGSDEIKDESVKDGLLKITLTRTGVVKAESTTIKCSVTHYGGITVTATEVKSSKCVHHNISIEPELADVTEGVAQNFTCTIYHSCQNENPTITWNYENMQVSSWNKKLSDLDQFRIAFSNITFVGAKEDHGKRLICTATFSGGNIETYVVLRVQEYQKPVDQILNETYFQYVADVIPKITALPRSCVVIPCSFKTDEEYTTELRVLWVTRKGGYMFHTDPVNVSDNFKGRTRLLGNPVEQNCTVEMDNVQTHDNGPFCFRAERENERYGFNNSCVFIIMQAPDKPVMSSLPEDIEPGTHVAVQCSVNHTCSSHPPEITWSVPTDRETISHNHMGGGVWETVSGVTFIPTGYEEKDEIVCTAKFWGGKTQENTAFLSIRRLQRLKLEDVGLYAVVPSLVFILIFVLAGVLICRRWHRQLCHDMHGSHTQSEQRRSFWNRFSSRFSMPEGRVAWTNRGNRSDIG
uniref:Ig-like domain-containing protein n=1 Tax=Cyprinus carpio carpio TaxID=630221 RepID=A0A9J8C1D0_CYPCA